VRRELVAHPALVPQLPTVDDHDEVAATAADQLDVGVRKCLLDVGGQTGRPRLIVSLAAVFNGHVHGVVGAPIRALHVKAAECRHWLRSEVQPVPTFS
jgi:hypothetical protein